MKKLFIFALLLCRALSSFSQSSYSGKVIDAETDEPLIGATIRVENSYKATSTDSEGNFSLFNLKETTSLIFSFIGYESDTFKLEELKKDQAIMLSAKSYQTDEVIINATRVGQEVPATVTNLNKDEINENNLGQDIPYLLQQTPSVVSTSDAGNGIGYTGIRIRGSDPSRINVTINGIPLNDPESHGVFWVNTPDLASSLQSIQIQRGIGTSTNGAGAFGATLNLETTGINEEAYGEINNSFGSFNSRKHTVKVGSGLINDHFSFEGRLSEINSDGYIDRASADLESYYLSGAYYGAKTIIKAITFGGQERTYQSWYGTPESRLSGNVDSMKRHAAFEGYSERRTQNLLNAGRTYNYYLYEDQVDNYGQDHYQLHLSHQFSEKFTANAAVHYTHGEGYFEEFKGDEDLADYGFYAGTTVVDGDTIEATDLVRRRWLNNDFYGFTYSFNYKPSKKLNITLGGALNNYEGEHYGRVIWAQYAGNSDLNKEYYFNLGKKLDGNTYLKTNYRASKKLLLFADMQVRSINYEVVGVDNDKRRLDINEDFLFFNPKVGARLQINKNIESYFFAGISNREPNRADFIDQNPNTPPSEANKAETMRNLETGFTYSKSNYQLSINFYLMDYDNQLVNTGQLNDVGSPIRQNVDRSYRAGTELQLGVKISDKVSASANATFSQNKIQNFKYTLYDYTNGFEIIEKDLGTTDIALSPEIIANATIKYQALKGLEIALLNRYVGDQYLDNTSNNNKKIDAYFVNDVRVSYQIPTKLIKRAEVILLVNNVFSDKYSANGYTYSYVFGQTVTENFYYPQAFRNYLVSLNLKF